MGSFSSVVVPSLVVVAAEGAWMEMERMCEVRDERPAEAFALAAGSCLLAFS